MEDAELLNEMIAQNPWWREGKIKLKENLIQRNIYLEVLKDLKLKQVTGIVGLRQVGKTTVLKQLIDHLLKNKIYSKNILYFSFDALRGREGIIRKILHLYFSQILKKPMSELKEQIYLFFDEIQKIEDWSEDVKSVYDKEHKIKFFVSGSSSTNILKGSGESLIGRINIRKLYPFSFREYLRFNKIEVEPITLDKIKYPIEAEKISILFDNYLKIGGLPGLYSLNKSQLKTVLKTIIDLAFYRDIVNLFEVKRSDILEGLFYSFIKESGNVINYNKLSSSLKTKFETVKTYIEYLDRSFIISKSLFFSKSAIKTFEKNPKVYVSDNSFFILDGTKIGLIVESCVFNHLTISGNETFYWQDTKKREVDIILKKQNKLIPIEVKYKSQITKNDLRSLLKFCDKFKLKKGIVVTKDLFKKEEVDKKEILFVPVWLFLLTK